MNISSYDELVRLSRERAVLSSCSALLAWDEQTTMPPGGAEARAEQLALLAGLTHERATSPRVGELLADLESPAHARGPDSIEAVNIRELRRTYDRQSRLPQALVTELARVTSSAQHEWIAARQSSDYPRFQPWLERIVALKRQEAACVQPGSTQPYDALLDEYEPGTTTARLQPIFQSLRDALPPLVSRLADAPRQPDPALLSGHFPIDRQKLLGEMAADALGFDRRSGRLDISAHPFCSGLAPGDCRITTRYRVDDFAESFFGVLHETGHALYEQGLLPEHYGTPMGEAVSLGVHESQSRLWENFIGRGKPFWTYWLPITRRIFPETLSQADPDLFLLAVNRVRPSLIRTQADEITYNLHIGIRFELERDLLSGDLPVADLPSAWNDLYQRDLGLEPPNDALGCLQDIHWSAGLFGYFPTYTLGNVYAAQLHERARLDLPDLDATIERGDTSPLLDWLRVRVHRHGHRHQPATLIEMATGSPPDPTHLLMSLESRYCSLYGLH